MDANMIRNRRHVLTAALGAGGLLALPRIAPGVRGGVRSAAIREAPYAERHFRNPAGPSAPGIAFLSCRVEVHDDGERATEAFEKHYAGETTPDEDETFAEISFSGVTEHLLPLDMIEFPHRFATYTTVAGAAAFEADHAVGVVRREEIVWLYVTQGHGAAEIADTIGEIAASMVEREIGDGAITVDADGQHHGQFWDLLPTLDDVPGGLVLVADESPAGAINALGTPFPERPES